MLLALIDLIFLIIKTLFHIIVFIIKSIIKLFIFILKNKSLRFPFLLLTLGYLFNIKFNYLATIYFFFLMHLCALKFNIYKRLFLDLSYLKNKIYTSYEVSHSLKSLQGESIVLNNISLENDYSDACSIDDLVITRGGVFIIKSINNYIDNDTNNIYINSKYNKNTKVNQDKIVDSTIIDDASKYCRKCSEILTDILCSDIPIFTVITLPNDDSVILNDKNLIIPVITTNDLPFFIRNNINNNVNCSPIIIKDNILENKVWIFDILLSKFITFMSHSKIVISFFIIFFILYYFYITSITYILYKLIK